MEHGVDNGIEVDSPYPRLSSETDGSEQRWRIYRKQVLVGTSLIAAFSLVSGSLFGDSQLLFLSLLLNGFWLIGNIAGIPSVGFGPGVPFPRSLLRTALLLTWHVACVATQVFVMSLYMSE